MRLLTPIVYAPRVHEAFRAMLALTDEERTRIMCWFCEQCGRHIGPGEPACKHPEEG